MTLTNEQTVIIDDLMKKVDEDVSKAIRQSIQLVDPPSMLPITYRASIAALRTSAMILDAAKGVDYDKIPTRESFAMTALMALHHSLGTDDVWGAAVADMKKYFPDYQAPKCEIMDLREKKAAA